MCFSATASFAAAGILVPCGVFTIYRAARTDRRWLPFAAFPLVFGVQQAIEGAVWLAIGSGDTDALWAYGRSFLFFSHFFWLAWVPLTALVVEDTAWRRRVLAALSLLGAAFGLSIFLPAAIWSDGLKVYTLQGSIYYDTRLIYEGIVPRLALYALYGAIVLAAFFLSSRAALRWFGLLIAGSIVVAVAYFSHAYISVWCYFAAVLSAYVVFAIGRADGRVTA